MEDEGLDKRLCTAAAASAASALPTALAVLGVLGVACGLAWCAVAAIDREGVRLGIKGDATRPRGELAGWDARPADIRCLEADPGDCPAGGVSSIC